MDNGKYVWKPENVSRAHMLCQNKAEHFMKKGSEKVIIANTNTTEKEMKPYYDLAAKYGYTVFSIIVENRHNGVNEHNVPETTLEVMKKRFDIKL